MPEVVARGLRFHVQRLAAEGAGRGREDEPPVAVFVHGLVMDNLSSFYFTLGNPAARAAFVVLYDLRGHGLSERPREGYGLEEMRGDLEGLLDALDVRAPVHLVGNSFGGLIALALATGAPARVASLVLVDSFSGTPGWGRRMAETLSLEGDARDLRIAASFKSWLGRHSERKSNRLVRTAEALVRGTSLVRDLADPAASPALDDAALRGVVCPVLALYGQDSDVRQDGERLARLVPRCTLRLLPGCTHSVLWEATDAVRDAVVGWLSARPA